MSWPFFCSKFFIERRSYKEFIRCKSRNNLLREQGINLILFGMTCLASLGINHTILRELIESRAVAPKNFRREFFEKVFSFFLHSFANSLSKVLPTGFVLAREDDVNLWKVDGKTKNEINGRRKREKKRTSSLLAFNLRFVLRRKSKIAPLKEESWKGFLTAVNFFFLILSFCCFLIFSRSLVITLKFLWFSIWVLL